MQTVSLTLVALAAAIPEEQVRAALRQDALGLAFAVVFVTLGLAATWSALRRRTLDPTILWFGLFALLFGVRLIAMAPTVRFAVNGGNLGWFYLSAAISYVIPVPVLLFLREAFPSWRRAVGRLLPFQAAFALLGLLLDRIAGRPDVLSRVNSVLMLAGFAVLIVALFRESGARASVRALRIGAVAFSFTVILRNMTNLGLVPMRVDLEPLGFAMFLGSLGVVILGRVQEREAQLVASNARRHAAEEASKVKSAVLAHISHELRTPLNAILGYTEMMLDSAEDTSDRTLVNDLGNVRSAAQHLLTLINSVLDISKIEAGKMSVAHEPVNVDVLVRDVVGIVQPVVAKNQNQLVVRVAPAVGVIQSDATKLRQVLVNLLSNAAKFTRAGVVTLDVRHECREDGEEIVFDVSDTGVGMTREQMGRLFEPFEQASPETSRQFGGSGLGLALSKRLSRLMRGRIVVESEPGIGSTFSLRLPLTVAAVEKTAIEPGAPPVLAHAGAGTRVAR